LGFWVHAGGHVVWRPVAWRVGTGGRRDGRRVGTRTCTRKLAHVHAVAQVAPLNYQYTFDGADLPDPDQWIFVSRDALPVFPRACVRACA